MLMIWIVSGRFHDLQMYGGTSMKFALSHARCVIASKTFCIHLVPNITLQSFKVLWSQSDACGHNLPVKLLWRWKKKICLLVNCPSLSVQVHVLRSDARGTLWSIASSNAENITRCHEGNSFSSCGQCYRTPSASIGSAGSVWRRYERLWSFRGWFTMFTQKIGTAGEHWNISERKNGCIWS